MYEVNSVPLLIYIAELPLFIIPRRSDALLTLLPKAYSTYGEELRMFDQRALTHLHSACELELSDMFDGCLPFLISLEPVQADSSSIIASSVYNNEHLW